MKQVGLQINLPIGDRDDVGRDVRRHVACLRFDDGQRRQRAVPILLADPRRSFEQPAVQVEHIAGIGFATGGPLQHERYLPVGHRVLGEVVIDDQRVHAVVHEPLAHRRTGKRHEVLVGSRVGGRRGHDDGVRHGASFFERCNHSGNGGLLLTDRHVDAVERAVRMVAGRLGRLVQLRLADHRVQTDGRLAGRAVADDQFALAPANGNHRVDRHDARLHRLVDRPPTADAGRDLLNRIGRVTPDRTFAVYGLPKHVHDPPQQALAHRHLQELAGGASFVTFLEVGVIAKDDHADFGLFEIQDQAGDAVAQVDHLVEHGVAQAFDLGDAIAELADAAHILLGGRSPRARKLRFNLRQQVAHDSLASKTLSSAASPARTLPSYTSLPTWMRIPAINAGR